VSVDRTGTPGGNGLASLQGSENPGDDELLATRAQSVRVLYFAAPAATHDSSEMMQLLEKRPDLGMTPNDDGIELRMRGESRTKEWVAADTREADVAVYLDGWRRKIERVGTMNFPDVARRRKMSGTPVIEVTIGADGSLLKTLLRRTSGHSEIDEAAMRILKLAAPYDAFPNALRATHDEIRIAYEWQFLGGESQGSAVYGEPGAPGSATLPGATP
jgi:protein TonB